MAFVSVPPFFCNIVYNLSNFVFYTELNAKLHIQYNLVKLPPSVQPDFGVITSLAIN
jgi:hypothetical protein